MGGDRLDRDDHRLHGGNAASLGPAGRGGPRQAGRADERDRIEALERENRALRQANEILRKASAYLVLAKLGG